jgi:hypothetical protein
MTSTYQNVPRERYFGPLDLLSRKQSVEKRSFVKAATRSKYLFEVREKRKEGHDIVHLDDAWINAHHTRE